MAKLKLINNFLVFVLPGAFAYFTAVVMRSFIDGQPVELQESAMLDGANHYQILFRIIIPLAKATIAAFLFFSIVGSWLDVTTNVLYITKRTLYTLQYVMHIVIKSTEARNIIDTSSTQMAKQIQSYSQMAYQPPTPQVIKMAIMAVVTFPLLFIYPFFQKYFVKGMLTGAVKA
jgi:putative aldouronate transport system permease protein